MSVSALPDSIQALVVACGARVIPLERSLAGAGVVVHLKTFAVKLVKWLRCRSVVNCPLASEYPPYIQKRECNFIVRQQRFPLFLSVLLFLPFPMGFLLPPFLGVNNSCVH